MIEDYYSRYSNINSDEVKEENFFDDLLDISTIDVRLLDSDRLELYQGLISALMFNVQRGLFDNDFFGNVGDRASKLKTALLRFAQTIKMVTLYSEKSKEENPELAPYSAMQMETVDGIKWLVNVLDTYAPDFQNENKLTDKEIRQGIPEKLDKRRTQAKPPTNYDRLMALQEFCPELIKKLLSSGKEVQKDVVHLITGVNKEDSYKLLFTTRKPNCKQSRIEEINELKKKVGI